jgi:hypothetical protein
MVGIGDRTHLPGHWRVMGVLEPTDSMLLFGISTAYIFAVVQVDWSMLHAADHSKRGP